MKNKIFILVALFSVFLLPGCGSAEAETAQNQLQEPRLTVQRPEREPDMMGMVSSMVGNQVTILLFNEEDMPMRGVRREDGDMDQGSTNREQQSGSFNPTQALGSAGGTGGGRAFGGQGMGGGFRGKGADGETFDREAMQAARDEMIKQLKEKSIGTEVVTIPVGIPIVGGGRPPIEGEPRGESQIDFSEIQKDSLITIWLNQDVLDKKVAEFVSLMGGGMRNFNGGNTETQN